MTGLEGRIAVITGASSGIGRAIAVELAACGASLCLVGRNAEALNDIAGPVRDKAGTAVCYRADITSDRAVRGFVAALNRKFGAVDILVHSAGAIATGLFEHAPVEELDSQYRINVRAPFVLTQALMPLIKQRSGQIVFINSSAGLNAPTNVSQYAATKHALKALADCLRAEVNVCGIRVASIYPGRTATPMQETVYKSEGRSYEPERLMQPEDVAKVVANVLRMERTVEVTDVIMRPLVKSS